MTDGTSHPVCRPAWQWLAPTIIVALTAGIELAGRSVGELVAESRPASARISPTTMILCAAALAIVSLVGVGLGRRVTTTHVVAVVLVCAFPAGVAAQLHLGARLQSDGFYYFAYLRSIAFDRDVNFTNDYRMLGLGDKAHLFTPTPTGYAQSAWTIGPAIVWAPFFVAGHPVAKGSAREPGRQHQRHLLSLPTGGLHRRPGLRPARLLVHLAAVSLYFPRGLAAIATAFVVIGSFMLWYIVKEPSMTHAPSMAGAAAFTWMWAATRENRTLRQWALLGALAGFIALIRWQNVALRPAAGHRVAMTLLPPASARRRRELRPIRRHGVRSPAAVVGFLPQMLAWKAIYGQWLAVSPIGPQIRWWNPHLVDILWSSRNGLFAASPVLYLGAIGLFLCWRRDRLFAGAALAPSARWCDFNASIQDWWGSAAFGGRRFDGTLPLLVVGTAVAAESTAALVARAPAGGRGGGGDGTGDLEPDVHGRGDRRFHPDRRADRFHDAGLASGRDDRAPVGHPFSWPANLWFAWRTGLAPSDYDLVWAFDSCLTRRNRTAASISVRPTRCGSAMAGTIQSGSPTAPRFAGHGNPRRSG